MRSETTEVAGSDTAAVRVAMRDPEYWDVIEFLYEEAALLDGNELKAWVDLLADDLEYTMPVRLTVTRDEGDGFRPDMGHFDDTKQTIEVRVLRFLNTRSAWAEDPPSRTRRYVCNVRVHRIGGELRATSSLLVTRNRGADPGYDLIAAERTDVLRRTEDGLRLAKRTVLVDQATMGTPNLAIFL